jgi:hypothetical protein
MVLAVIEHRVQLAVQHGEHACQHGEQVPALRIAGLAPGHKQPHQTAGQADSRRDTITGELQVASEEGQQHQAATSKSENSP